MPEQPSRASDRFLRPSQVEERYPLRAQTLASWRVKGIGPPYVRVGRMIVYPIEAIESWLAVNTVHPSAGEKS